MSAVWPQNIIPFSILLSTYGEQLEDNRHRFSSDSGRTLTRRKTSRRLDAVGGDILMTLSQYQVFLNFYTNDLRDGTLPFEARHPRTGQVTTFKFDESPPTMAPYGNKIRVTLQLKMSLGRCLVWFLETGYVDPYGVWIGERAW